MDTSMQQNKMKNCQEFIDEVDHDTSKIQKKILQPIEVGSTVQCKWRDKEWHLAKVIDQRKLNTNSSNYQYYIHYNDFDSCFDQWVDLDQLDLGYVELNLDERIENKVGRKKKSCNKTKVSHVEEKHDAYLRTHEEQAKVKNISKIELGRFEITTWYFSPFPQQYSNCEKLFFCEFCLTFLQQEEQLARHLKKCNLKCPPGDEIYRHGSLSMFEVDGEKNKIYGQNLCYLAKLFLDHKTLEFDVDNFLFYILCECDERGYHILGYFSKDKFLREGYNLSCILILPPYQRKGYGNFLISFSYELSKKEKVVGTPERPFSNLGEASYKKYWEKILLDILKEISSKGSKKNGDISIKDLSDMTAIHVDDIRRTLIDLKILRYQRGHYVFCIDPQLFPEHLKVARRSNLEVDPSRLVWTPYKKRGG